MSVFDVKPTSGEGGGVELPDEDNHVGALVALIDLGSHSETFKDEKTGKEKTKDVRKVYLLYELVNAPMSGTKGNHLIGRMYTLSLHTASALAQELEKGGVKLQTADGKPFPLGSLLGKHFMVKVNHKKSKTSDRVFANFGGISSVPKSLAKNLEAPKTVPFSWEIPASPDPAPGELRKLQTLAFLPWVWGYNERMSIPDYIQRSKEWAALVRREPMQPVGAGAGAVAGGDDGGGTEDEIPF